MEPTNKILETRSVGLYSRENITIKIKEEKISINKSDKKLFSQELKKFIVDGVEVQRIAKGEIKINTFIKIYLIEKIKIKFTNPRDTMVLIIPSIVKTF